MARGNPTSGAARVGAALQVRRRRLHLRWQRLSLDADRTPNRIRRRVAPQPSSGALCCVYRPDHVEHVVALVADARRAGLTPRLWALRDVAPALEEWTVGCGPGWRQALLNRVIPTAPDGWIVLSDDDVVMRVGVLATLLTIATRIGLDVVQPAHSGASRASTQFVRALRGVGARWTGFVEIGPVVAVGPAARSALLPLDESLEMGWGQDYLWARALASDGLAAGIVDAVRMRHLPQSGHTYDRAVAKAHLDECLARVGYASYAEPMVTYTTWRAGDLA